MQRHPADQLHVEVAHAQRADARLAGEREAVGQQAVEHRRLLLLGGVGHFLVEGADLLAHALVGKRLRPALALVDARDHGLHAAQLALVLGADDLLQDVVEHDRETFVKRSGKERKGGEPAGAGGRATSARPEELGSAPVRTGRARRLRARRPEERSRPRDPADARRSAARPGQARTGKRRAARTRSAAARRRRGRRRAKRRRRRPGRPSPSAPPRMPLRTLRASSSRGTWQSVSRGARLSSERPTRQPPPIGRSCALRRPVGRLGYSSRMNLRGLSATPFTRTS